jgi:hypothetical protein
MLEPEVIHLLEDSPTHVDVKLLRLLISIFHGFNSMPCTQCMSSIFLLTDVHGVH